MGVTFKKVFTGHFNVLQNDAETKYYIYNADLGCSGNDKNMYGICDNETGKHTLVGSLQKAKKVVTFWLK